MKILKENPPDWIMAGCLSKFRVDVSRTFWTYGDTIYNPGGGDIPDHIIAHEEQHTRQQLPFTEIQGGAEVCTGPEGWWKRYLSDPRFRLEQEADSYGRQYRFVCDHVKDRNIRVKYLLTFASQLSGPLYQLSVTQLQARQMIEVLSGQKKLNHGGEGRA